MGADIDMHRHENRLYEEFDFKRLTISIIVAIPVEWFLYYLGLQLTRHVYGFWHDLFGFDWAAYASRRIDVRRFLEFWHTGMGIHIIHVVIYYVALFFYEVKAKYFLLTMSIVAFVTSAIIFDLRQPGPGLFGDWGYSIVYNFLFSMIMLITFTVSANLMEEHTDWSDEKNLVMSFISSLLLGGIISYIVWLMLYRMFHG